LLLIAAVGGIGYAAWLRARAPKADIDGATAANLRGVGHMEQYEYAKAEKEFAEAARLAPAWPTARINLGIAMFNQQPDNSRTLTEHVARSRDIFHDILKTDPDNPYAHFCLGILDAYVNNRAEAYPHFAAVNKVDPDDAHTWLRLGVTHPDGDTSPAARECYERALKRDPYLSEALYRVAMLVRADDPDRQTALLKELEELRKIDRTTESGYKYSEMGKYAEVIGRDPAAVGKPLVGPLPLFEPLAGFKVVLAAGARWATGDDLDPTRRAARDRFGAAIVLFDYNGDGRTDVFLTSAVVENGRVRDLLLRNDGQGTFTDVTAAAGLGTPRPSLGAAAADYDNDGKPDLVVTGAGEQHLFRNRGDGTFEDVSAAVKLDQVKGVCLGCGWADIDEDGDLDLVLCAYAGGATSAFDGATPGGGVLLFENVGVAPPGKRDDPPALSTAFRRVDKLPPLVPAGRYVNLVVSDVDNDRDVDLLLFADKADPVLIENQRLMRFARATPDWLRQGAHAWNGGLVLDANHDERSDLFLVRSGAPPVLLLSNGVRDFAPGGTNSPALKQAVAADIDLDGWTDVVGLTADGKPVLLHNRADGTLTRVPDAFGMLADARGLAVADLDGDGAPDLLLWTDAGLQLHRNRGNGNGAVAIAPTGRQAFTKNYQRTNTSGIGTWLAAQSGPLWTGAERTTVASGLGQSLVPTVLGIGKRDRADLIRARWPDGVVQAELGVAAGAVYSLVEQNRKETSCPLLLTWDGERFVFVTDFLGAGSMGESGPDGATRPPRPEESVKIEPGRLVPRDGRYVIKIAEPMDEVLYLDHLRLDVIDHPADAHVFPDERFASGTPEPTQKLLAFRTRHAPKRATDEKGRDVTKLVLDRDRLTVDTFACRSWLGYAEDHALTLDFPDLAPGGKWYLVLAGWTDYPYPESIYAATRAGIELKEPTLERFDAANGKWLTVCDLGFPAGLPRVMTRELPADFPGGRLRISTNMQVYWDQIYLARAEDAETVGRVTALDVTRADLAARGFMQEVYPDGRPPVAYDDAKTEPRAVTRWKGHLTRLGDVTELLRAADDRFVLCGPGDEITVRFDATNLPPLPAGWERSFVLRTRGYCKDASLTTVTGGTVGPLPFRAMPNYPDFGSAKPPATDAETWHTRPAGGR
jgi:tetratricopeptide (TPR) repeat protein